MSKHTPGPWAMDDGGDGELEVWAPDTGYAMVAICSGTEPSDEERANARLIAAAPDLLRAAKFALENSETGQGWSLPAKDRARLRAAIAKADGTRA